MKTLLAAKPVTFAVSTRNDWQRAIETLRGLGHLVAPGDMGLDFDVYHAQRDEVEHALADLGVTFVAGVMS